VAEAIYKQTNDNFRLWIASNVAMVDLSAVDLSAVILWRLAF
jgi:hypothetical protein